MGDGIEVPEFSIRADSVELFVDARLSLRTGHRYGLVAPNGKGKTTRCSSTSLYISPTSPYISLHLPISPLHLPISPYLGSLIGSHQP